MAADNVLEIIGKISEVVTIILFFLGMAFFLFVLIRDRFFKNENYNNQGGDGEGGYEDIW
jgi:hypothetical protein